ncbi:Nucleoside-diphosphate-sugar epimerase [Clostridium cavendishii DSM 21758]|uniref:UDP-glucose 4-epimerase n=1 Tax=Clostridium cavendishii DSM 21758 TaxID=1121302 RepID=A0A1M6NSR5_9CLOT|nr:NAD-dependent epimerase/dehydratase family protein [Clostridium cavendishii]SHJ98695.1 Nucleoside-diphosphate-sugar epimerase [Clostridium cavendishii DSM 21758]
MKVLVMGGSKFVSESIAKKLIELDYEVHILTRGKESIDYTGYARHLICDRHDKNKLTELLYGTEYDYVFDINGYTKSDIQILIGALNKSKIKRYVYCSSASVYIEKNTPLTEESEKVENDKFGKYGLDKKEAENYLVELYNRDGFPITIFRPSYIYGEGNNKFREAYIFKCLEEGRVIPIPESNNKIQFIHIEDLTKAFISSINLDKAIGEVYNLSNEESYNIEEYIDVIKNAIFKNGEISKIKDKTIDVRSYFPFADANVMLSIEKLKDHGLRTPKITLERGIERAYKWYKTENPKLSDSRMTDFCNKNEEIACCN